MLSVSGLHLPVCWICASANALTILYASWRKTSSPSLPFPLSLVRLTSLARVGEVERDEPWAMRSLNAAVLSL